MDPIRRLWEPISDGPINIWDIENNLVYVPPWAALDVTVSHLKQEGFLGSSVLAISTVLLYIFDCEILFFFLLVLDRVFYSPGLPCSPHLLYFCFFSANFNSMCHFAWILSYLSLASRAYCFDGINLLASISKTNNYF